MWQQIRAVPQTSVEDIKSDLLGELDEWLGFDIPDEGTEDYAYWQERLHAINAIETLDDVLVYLEAYSRHPEEALDRWGFA